MVVYCPWVRYSLVGSLTTLLCFMQSPATNLYQFTPPWSHPSRFSIDNFFNLIGPASDFINNGLPFVRNLLTSIESVFEPSIHSLFTLPIIDSIPKHEVLLNNMPLRGADICTVHIWLDLWFWAKRMDMTTRLQIDCITWNAANIYGLSKRQLRRDLKMWSFEKTICEELARDIVKARKIAVSFHKGRFGASRLIEEMVWKCSQC